MPFRAEEAARLFQHGEGARSMGGPPENPAADLQKFGIRFVGEEGYSREVLIYLGVQESSVHLFPDPIANTEQEVNEITREMQRLGKTKVIIVTSPPHTRRVRTLWKRLAARQNQAIVRAAFEDPFDADHWWRNTRDTFSVGPGNDGLGNAERLDRTSRAAHRELKSTRNDCFRHSVEHRISFFLLLVDCPAAREGMGPTSECIAGIAALMIRRGKNAGCVIHHFLGVHAFLTCTQETQSW
jgi:hypothetical protein